MRRWTVAQYEGQRTVRSETADAANAMLPVDHSCELELCLIEALDEAMAVTVAHDLPDSAFVPVTVTPQGEPTVLNWHGAGAGGQEQLRYERVTAVEAKRKQDEIEREVHAFRAHKYQEAGLRMG